MFDKDILADMLKKQDDLQKIVGTVYDVPFVKDMTLSLIVELGEFLAELPFKNWSKKHLQMREDGCKFIPGHEDLAIEEIIDVWFFLLNITNFAGLSAEDIHREYLKKWEKNANRQHNGY